MSYEKITLLLYQSYSFVFEVASFYYIVELFTLFIHIGYYFLNSHMNIWLSLKWLRIMHTLMCLIVWGSVNWGRVGKMLKFIKWGDCNKMEGVRKNAVK